MIAADLLARIPGCEDGRAPQRILPLPGGRGSNLVLRVDTQVGRFVFRQRRLPLDRPGSPATTELLGQRVAAAAGLAPRIIEAAPDGGWILMEYVDAPVWTCARLLTADGVRRIGTQLARLHALEPPAVPRFDAVQIAAAYLEQLGQRDVGLAAQQRPLWSRVVEIARALEQASAPGVLNHGDLQPGNLLGEGPLLIDWEYAQVVDPTYDIACLLTYHPALERQLDLLLHAAGLDSRRHLATLTLLRETFGCLNQLWEAVNAHKAG